MPQARCPRRAREALAARFNRMACCSLQAQRRQRNPALQQRIVWIRHSKNRRGRLSARHHGNITGSGWQPGEAVSLTLVESPLIDTHGPYTVHRRCQRNISDSSFTTDIHDPRHKILFDRSRLGLPGANDLHDTRILRLPSPGNGSGSVAVSDTTTPGDNTTCTGSSNPCNVTTGNNDVGTLSATATRVLYSPDGALKQVASQGASEALAAFLWAILDSR